MTTQQKSNRVFYTLAAVLGSLILSLVVVGILGIIGRINGSEFCPDTFTERTFGYSRLPLLHFRMTKTTLGATSPCPGSIAKYLTVTSSPESRWDVAQIDSNAASASLPYPASLLSHAVHHDASWDSWTTEHPKLAAILWPGLQQLAQEECYFAIPKLMENSRDRTDEENQVLELQSEVDRACVEAAILRSDYLRSQNDLEGAYRCLEWGRSRGSHPELEKRIEAWKISK